MPAGTPLIVHFLLVVPMIMLFAAFSWHFIEKPILKMRKKFSFVAQVRLSKQEVAETAPATHCGCPADRRRCRRGGNAPRP